MEVTGLSMIRQAVANRYDRKAESGRSEPLRVAVRTDDGEEHEVFLKASRCPELTVESLVNEFLAACLAGDLGLPITEPFVTHLRADWIGSIHDAAVRKILQESVPVAFASKDAGRGWGLWSDADRLSSERRDAALAIFAFDAFIANDDRRPAKPNCKVKGDEFRIFDHELAFYVRQKVFPKLEPWKPGYLDQKVTRGPNGHIFGPQLKRLCPDLRPLYASWSKLTVASFSEYGRMVPRQWAVASGAVDDAVKHLSTVRERLDECFTELQRALS